MDPEQTSHPELEKRLKEKISYNQLLLWGINDVRRSLGFGNAVEAEMRLTALVSILTSDVRPLADRALAPLRAEHRKRMERLWPSNQRVMSYELGTYQREKNEGLFRFVAEGLSRIVEILDDHGFVRDFRQELVGSE